jgi:hypothetical protein
VLDFVYGSNKKRRRCEMENVKPETVIEILKKHNVHISFAQAQLILSFMYKLAKISLTKNERA